jgi:Mce-associated membrane protein
VTRDLPRRPKTSRTPTSRPRKLAGQGAAPSSVESGDLPVESGPLPVESGDLPVLSPDSTVGTPDSTVGTPDSTEKRRLLDLFDRRRATTVLVSLVVVLAVAAGGLFAWDQVSDDAPTKPSKQPVVVSRDDATAAVDAAAKAAQTILTRTYQDYDKQIDDATALMTDAYAKKFRLTADDVEDQFVAAKTDQQVRMVAQGVVHATRTEVQALLFMNYYVSKDGGDTTYTPYRVLVTVVHTDRGWLVSDIDTK